MTGKTIARAVAAVLLAALVMAMPQVSRAAPDLYTHVTLLDPVKQTRTPDSYILVENGRIAAVGVGKPRRSLPPGRVHDLAGHYALPGFIDAHAHITLGPMTMEMRGGAPAISFRSADELSQRNGKVALAYGVTTVRNPGGETAANARYAQMIASGTWVGPESLSAGAIIEPPPFVAPYFAYPRTEAEWQAEALDQASRGMRYFKLYQDLTPAELATGIRVAHEHGLKAIAHLNRVSWTQAARLGIDGLEHALPTSPELLEPAQRSQYLAELGPVDASSKFMYRWFELVDYDGPVFKEMVRELAARKIPVDLTLVASEVIYNADDLERAYPAEFRRYEDPQTLASGLTALRISASGWTADDFARARAVMPKVLQLARVLYEAGAVLYIGTDGHGGSWYYPRELQLHVLAGIPPWAVLAMATSKAADILGIGKRTGRIAPGYEADVTFLDGDPVADMAQAGQVYGVLNNGQFYLSSKLLEEVTQAAKL